MAAVTMHHFSGLGAPFVRSKGTVSGGVFNNPDKLDGKLLVSSFGCAAEIGDIELLRHSVDKGTYLGCHLIQTFELGDASPEEAHEIGMHLEKILGGKYEFVLTTHIDKGHIHNHLIFNAVSFTDHKHYHSNKRSYHEVRRASDRLCREHGIGGYEELVERCDAIAVASIRTMGNL